MYCSVQDVRLALAPISMWNDPSTAATLPDAQIEDAIGEAEGTVNAYLALRYTIETAPVEELDIPVADPPTFHPMDVAPVPVRGWTRTIAAYLATLTYRKGKDLGPDDPIRLRYNMVMGFLEAVRDHRMSIDLIEVTSDAGEGGVTVVNQYEGHLFDLEDVGLGFAGKNMQRFEPRQDVW